MTIKYNIYVGIAHRFVGRYNDSMQMVRYKLTNFSVAVYKKNTLKYKKIGLLTNNIYGLFLYNLSRKATKTMYLYTARKKNRRMLLEELVGCVY